MVIDKRLKRVIGSAHFGEDLAALFFRSYPMRGELDG